MKWDQQVEHESFLMTNISPQSPSFNRGIWKLLETSVRNHVNISGHNVIVYVGSIYNTQDKKIGQGVVIPHSFYKIVIDKATNTCFSWKFPHISPYTFLGSNFNKFKSSIKEIETESGVNFKIPEKCDETAKW